MANFYEITGRIYSLSPIEEIKTKKGDIFRRQELILEQQLFDRYTGQPFAANHPAFEFTGKVLSVLASFKKGDMVTISFDVNGALYADKTDGSTHSITRLRAFRITPFIRTTQPAAEPPLTSADVAPYAPDAHQPQAQVQNELPF